MYWYGNKKFEGKRCKTTYSIYYNQLDKELWEVLIVGTNNQHRTYTKNFEVFALGNAIELCELRWLQFWGARYIS